MQKNSIAEEQRCVVGDGFMPWPVHRSSLNELGAGWRRSTNVAYQVNGLDCLEPVLWFRAFQKATLFGQAYAPMVP